MDKTATIIRGIVGSRAYGTNLDNKSDYDMMGIFMESKDQVLGLDKSGTHVYCIQPDGSYMKDGDTLQPGGQDVTLFSLREFCRLALQGNPNVLPFLFLPHYEYNTGWGESLLLIRDAFYSKEAGKRFMGYLTAQLAKLEGRRSPAVSRPALVAQYGYDTKFAMQAIRLGFQGVEFMKTQQISIPMQENQRKICIGVRNGRFTKAEVIQMVMELDALLVGAVAKCDVQADRKTVNEYLSYAHLDYWQKKS